MPGCRCGTCRKRLPTLIREPPCAMTEPARPWTGTPPTSSPLTLLAQRDRPRSPQAFRLAEPEPNGVKLSLQGCRIARMARPGQQVVAGDRLGDRMGRRVCGRVLPAVRVDRV